MNASSFLWISIDGQFTILLPRGMIWMHGACCGRKMAKVTNVVTEIAGAFSGGSLNTALGFYANPTEGLFPHPYSLNPEGHR